MEEKIKAVGTRQEVYEGKARHTLGGMFKDDIFLNSKGQYVSKKMSESIRSRFIRVTPKDETPKIEKPKDETPKIEKPKDEAPKIETREVIDNAFIRIRGYLPVRGAIRQFYNKILQTAPNLPIDEMAQYIIAQAKAERVKL